MFSWCGVVCSATASQPSPPCLHLIPVLHLLGLRTAPQLHMPAPPPPTKPCITASVPSPSPRLASFAFSQHTSFSSFRSASALALRPSTSSPHYPRPETATWAAFQHLSRRACILPDHCRAVPRRRNRVSDLSASESSRCLSLFGHILRFSV